ncbi:GDYXXLXY domain-containing protein [Spirochaetota bacterium]
MKKRPVLFWALVTLQLCFLGAMVLRQELLLYSKTTVLLRCIPVDPRSLFSGDYVALKYDISSLEPDNEGMPLKDLDGHRYKKNDYVYVLLKEGGKEGGHHAFAYASSMGKAQKHLPDGAVIMRGIVSEAFYPNGIQKQQKGSVLEVRYGVESYFVPEREGKRIEDAIEKRFAAGAGEGQSEVLVELALNNKGISAIKRLFINREAVNFK